MLKPVQSLRFKSVQTSWFALVILSAAGLPVMAETGSCSLTSQSILKACTAETSEEYWTQFAVCQNLVRRSKSVACLEEAEEARQEARQTCLVQYKARLDICKALGESPYAPVIRPADFVNPSEIGQSVQPNPYFPLTPGITRVYESGDERIEISVLRETKQILGVTCVVVHDTVTVRNEIIEDTLDWYAQDIRGNVWYFGELSRSFEGGQLAHLDGSWEAGVDGAKPGIIMKSQPHVGDVYRQEFALGEAEDMARILNGTASATVPAASCDQTCLVTRDFLPFEPDHIENKYYAPGIGFILEVDPETGERVELIEVRQD